MMNWINLIWHLIAGAFLSLSIAHLLAWLRKRDELEHLWLSFAMASVSAMAVLEPMAMQAGSMDEYAQVARWFHVPAAVLLIALVPFVHLRYGVGSLWLGIGAIVVRVASLVANFNSGVNLNFSEITALTPMEFLGTPIVAPQGIANPWMVLGPLSIGLLICFLVHGAWQLSRRATGERNWLAIAILISLVFFLLFGGVWAVLVTTATVSSPFLVVPPFVVVVLALNYHPGAQLLGFDQLIRNLADSEKNRRVGEIQLQLAGRLSRMGAWAWDCRDGSVNCSNSALALLDLPPDQPVDRQRLAESISAEHLAALLDSYHVAVQGEGELQNEFCVALQDGGTRWLSAAAHLERDAAGKPLSVQGVLIDISLMREADKRFHRVVEMAPNAILVARTDGSITFANQCAERIFGYTQKELSILSVDDLVPLPWCNALQILHEGYANEPVSRDMATSREVLALHKDGSQVAVEVKLSAIPSDSGLQILIFVNDITARRLAEREAGDRRDELAHLSRVTLLAELSGSLAHELNQPLTAILSNAQASMRFLARDPPELDEVRECLRDIVDSDKRAGEVIRRLRAMLRNEPPDHQQLDLNQVVTDVLHILHSDLVARNIDISLRLQADLPVTSGDRVQLQQVLLNLIMNACDAMASCAEQPQLTISTQEIGNNMIRWDVSDRGTGIPDGDIERIFTPFVTSKSSGLGLGLAVCKTIVLAHGGQLWAENNVDGPGATFYLQLQTDQSSRRPVHAD